MWCDLHSRGKLLRVLAGWNAECHPACLQANECVWKGDAATLSSGKILGGNRRQPVRMWDLWGIPPTCWAVVLGWYTVFPPGLKIWIPGIGWRLGVCSDWLLMTDIPLHACPIFYCVIGAFHREPLHLFVLWWCCLLCLWHRSVWNLVLEVCVVERQRVNASHW